MGKVDNNINDYVKWRKMIYMCEFKDYIFIVEIGWYWYLNLRVYE